MIQRLEKPRRVRDSDRLAWVRLQPCILAGLTAATGFRMHECLGPVEASHIREEGHGGMGTKPSDFDTLPKCQWGHNRYHKMGRRAFEQFYGIDLDALLLAYNKRYAAETSARVPKRERTKNPIAQVQISHCICGKSHELLFARVTQGEHSVAFTCPVRRSEVTAKFKGHGR